MNTPESDNYQVEYGRQWLRAKHLKRMRKLEEKLEKEASKYFEEPVAVIYARKGARVVDRNGEEYMIDPGITKRPK